MSPLTDDRIAELVREAFVAHEDLADPLGLALLDAPAPRRTGRLVVALAAAAAVVIGAVAFAVTHGDHASPGPAAPPTHPVSDESNRARTVQVARSSIESVPLLPGGHAVGHAPVARLKRTFESINPSLDTVRRTGWWTAPGTIDAAAAYLLAHPPSGFSARPGTASDSVSRGVQYADASPNPAYTSRFVVLEIVRDGDRVAVRGDTYVNWRPARTGSSLVGDNVHAVLATRLRARQLGDPPHEIRRALVTDPAEIARIIARVDGWYGLPPTSRSCPLPTGPVHSYVLRFRTGYGPVVMRGTAYCNGGVQLIRRGEAVAPVIDGARPFERLVRRLTR